MKFWRLPLDSEEHSVPQGRVRIIENRCKGCGYCTEFCPKGCLKVSDRFNAKGYHPPEVVFESDDCVNCGLCTLICPEFAIYSETQEPKKLTEEDIRNATAEKRRKEKAGDG